MGIQSFTMNLQLAATFLPTFAVCHGLVGAAVRARPRPLAMLVALLTICCGLFALSVFLHRPIPGVRYDWTHWYGLLVFAVSTAGVVVLLVSFIRLLRPPKAPRIQAAA